MNGQARVSISEHPVGDICPVAVGEGAGKGGTLLRRERRTIIGSLSLISSFMHRQHTTTLHRFPAPCPSPSIRLLFL